MELCVPEYSMLNHIPSMIAASALYLSRKLNKTGEWVSGLCSVVQCTCIFTCTVATMYSSYCTCTCNLIPIRLHAFSCGVCIESMVCIKSHRRKVWTCKDNYLY